MKESPSLVRTKPNDKIKPNSNHYSASLLSLVEFLHSQMFGFLQFIVRPRDLTFRTLQVLVEFVPLMLFLSVAQLGWFLPSPVLAFVGEKPSASTQCSIRFEVIEG